MSLWMAVVSGGLVMAGSWCLILTVFAPGPRLGDAFALLDGRALAGTAEPTSAVERLGARLEGRPGFSLGADLRRQLRMVQLSAHQHLAAKAIGALIGLVVPGLVAGWLSWLSGTPVVLPVLVGLVGAGVGFVLPDLRLRHQDRAVTEDATEALLTFADLVTLERMANLSGSQALRSAAAVSEAPIFLAIRETLERARLEQRPPYQGLQALGEELKLPALVDIADVMRLDESGAALAGALRARVRELRHAHLNRQKVQATEDSERLGMLMVVPSLILGLLFLTPPLLRLITP